ncbi:MAG: LysR family transcriptional regulator [Oscillospiraceae bacterium]|jgi:DNA-binding transcriptional LysR family regulator|nr:LysR family transcriptional regulator [Oscillospiraceae bacterium]
MDLLQLRYFATVAKYQNITKAAMEHSIPQPAMSRTMSNLEKELGIPLFERHSNRIILNKNGMNFYASIRQTLQTLDDSITNLKASNGTLMGEIKLLILQSRNVVIDLISDFTKIYPNIKFTIYHSSSYPKDFEFDFCLASEEFHLNNLKRFLLFTEEIMLAVDDTHPLAQKKYVTIDDIRNERFISMPRSSELGNVMQKACKKYTFTPENVIVCDDPFYVRKYVSLGMGVAFAPSTSWNNLWSPNIALLHIDNANFTRSTYLYSRSTKYKFDECQAFKNYLVTHLSEF